MSDLKTRYEEILKKIANACKRSGRSVSDVHLLAVTKMQPDELIEDAYALGVRHFGENYLQELERKKEKFSHLQGVNWHLIGPLQSGKVKRALETVDYFHALDSVKMLDEFVKRAGARKKPLPVFIQVNVDDEASKSGIALSDVNSFVNLVRKESSLQLVGLMAIPDPTKDTRAAFRKLKSAADKNGDLLLSMGMSDDFESAIEEGSHWIRIGRTLFGERHVS